MQSRPSTTRLKRRGLTLMELVVVMTVMAAVAAIALPLFPNLLRRAHKVTDATQTSETAKSIQLYQGLTLSYPDGYDLLTDGTDFPDYLPADDGNVFGGFVTTGTLTEDEVKALGRVGIVNVNTMAATAPNHPTMDPYDAAAPVALDDTITVCLLDTATATANLSLKNVIDADPTARFIVFGVGSRCTMVGKTLQDAPTSVPQNAEFTPATLYSRVGVIYKVSGAEVDLTERARFVGCVAMEDDELESTEKDIIGYYEVAASDSLE